MKFKVGKKYKTVSGLTVKITEIDNDPYYPVNGYFVKTKTRDCWSKSGQYNVNTGMNDLLHNLVAKKKRFTKKDVKRAYDKGYNDGSWASWELGIR
jgi:hypothetical protein